jgi:SAM-dependent methyltransferase
MERLREHAASLYRPGAPPITAPPRQKWPTSRYEAFRHHFPSRFNGGSILELGAGSGLPCRLLIADSVPFKSYLLSDFSEQIVTAQRHDFADDPRVSAAVLDMEALPDGLDQFDAIVFVGVLSVLIDPFATLTWAGQHVTPDGIVWITAPNMARVTRRLKLLTGRFPATGGRDEGLTTFDGRPVGMFANGHLQYFTYRSLEGLLRRAGFAQVERIGYSPTRIFSRGIDDLLARSRPTVFADICVAARLGATGEPAPS